MRASLDRLGATLRDVAALPEDIAAEELYEKVDSIEARVRAATEEIARAAVDEESAPVHELRELQNAFEARRARMSHPLNKLLHGVGEMLKGALERAMFVDMSRQTSAPCGCAVWRAVANGGGLSARPTFSSARVIEEVDDVFESYRLHECSSCGARWLQDFNPDSDPSVTRWWAR